MVNSGSKRDRATKLLAMGIGSCLVWYFAGPMAGEVGRHTYEAYYHLLHGTPSITSLEYWFEYLPLRGHVTHYSYQYGHMLCAALAAPFFYKIPDLFRFCLTSSKARNMNDTSFSVEELDNESVNLSHLTQLLNDTPDVPLRRSISLDGGRQLLVNNSEPRDELSEFSTQNLADYRKPLRSYSSM